ncbi:hypothetical protein [Vibrio parahaemolyticus]|uniref:hypothetical protein n=1 Tax=Vibrio parahaemolyticus TaxID=670 RepID=UPI001123C47B|nr:hypothetical protein [Vibrio parahaemolyticus]EJC7036905.1 hypothetical protein [Vibrio parahaemolyticus]MCX8850281.1 hypothetical protein [Vibrio parahaemolyticus]TOK51788.1 hypothetical protein CGI17_21995 [Vibrio parahaemolyticus]TOK78302.1 hypothetical protein CGI11_19845 [Vibrio parahaemolyticus]TOK83952.1 hypothetical protein CGI10_19240 [Vibrio parahaemolyticus]
MNDVILTKQDLAERQKRSVESITTACSRNPSSLPPFFKLGTNRNSPIRFRLSDVIAWEDDQAEKQKKLLEEQERKLAPRWLI